MRVLVTWCLSWMLLLNLVPARATAVSSAAQEEAAAWAEIALHVQQAVETASYVEAREHLAQLSDRFAHATELGKHLRLRGIHLLSSLLLALEAELNRVSVDEQRAKIASYRLLLAFDSLTGRHQPLWHRSYEALRIPAVQWWRLSPASPWAQQEALHQRLREAYALVRPALLLTHAEGAVGELDSLLVHLQRELPQEQRLATLQSWFHALEGVFRPQEETALSKGEAQLERTGASHLAIGLVLFILIGFLYVAARKHLAALRATARMR